MLEGHLTLGPGCSSTTKSISLLDKVYLLDTGRHVHFDNIYSCPEILKEMVFRQIYGCGNVRSNRKYLQEAVTEDKMKPGESIFRCNGPRLALKWCEKGLFMK